MKVKIMGARSSRYWYANKVGDKVEVESRDGTHWMVKGTPCLLIEKRDTIKEEQI